jgi:cell division septum initiation protein DivIVA
VKRNRALRQRIRDLEDHLASLESHVSEPEEETAKLRKENEEVLGRDDDRGSDGGDYRDAIMDFYEPATPSEEDPEEGEPHVSVD